MIRRLAPIVLLLTLTGTPSLAAGTGAASNGTAGLWPLFVQSFDLFSVVLLIGSVTAGAYVFRCLVEVRAGRIIPSRPIATMNDLLQASRVGELRNFVSRDGSFPALVVRAALSQSDKGREAMREAAELTASDLCARWFRKIEPLNVIGNLGPLVGLAGTVWGMILAFTTLGAAGGEAGPADLSLGISKALFHTLLGLCLAIPCLLVFGFYRSVIDALCTRAMVISSEMVEKLPAHDDRKP